VRVRGRLAARFVTPAAIASIRVRIVRVSILSGRRLVRSALRALNAHPPGILLTAGALAWDDHVRVSGEHCGIEKR